MRLLFATAGFAALHLFLWWRLVYATTERGSRWRPIGAAALATLAGSGLAARFLVPSPAPLWLQQLIGWPGWLWFGAAMYLVGLLAVAEPGRWWLLRARRTAQPAIRREAGRDPDERPAGGSADASPAAAGMPRRVVLSRAIGLGAVVATGTIVGHGTVEGNRTPRLKPVSLPLTRLAREFDGYRIAVVGDVHLSALHGRGFCQRVVAQINRAQPDLIAIVGDLASGEAYQLRDASEPLAGLRARDGAYYVVGNAEHYTGADEWIARVEELGLTALPNTRVELPGFDLAGVNDLIVEERDLPGEVGPDLAAALSDRDPARASILLAHQPNIIREAVDWGVDLQLSGHTHGGQLWPVHALTRMRNVQLGGLQGYDGTQLYVTNGAGTNGPPLRVGAKSDITVMTLRSAQA
ncbi:metallophosphoesterase [Natronosporangium hydrolyticum]|uniref:Metallophosphoesterase n=1 Tax=Natronosporangium hydrolyticum TaxID=2811111 RepID=A0A895Y7N6_9ACTN|nr:metallophosphoesterase [Natronosporangium hydrolyticum]QSB13744.1 metallophosphoesterase [Natronosporangium hydrolyticum]